jgi:hypothetical protein
VGFLNPVVDRHRIARLDVDRLGDPLEHQLAGGRGAQHIDRVIHRGGDSGIVERRAEFLRIAWVGVHQDDEEAARAHCNSGDSDTAADNRRLRLLNEAEERGSRTHQGPARGPSRI